jgi:UDP:flavonoid glycosyltransferase YjiC (YdhE family)
MIVIPLFADQDSNAERVHSRGRGIKLEISDLTQDKLEGAIQEITTNTRLLACSVSISKY